MKRSTAYLHSMNWARLLLHMLSVSRKKGSNPSTTSVQLCPSCSRTFSKCNSKSGLAKVRRWTNMTLEWESSCSSEPSPLISRSSRQGEMTEGQSWHHWLMLLPERTRALSVDHWTEPSIRATDSNRLGSTGVHTISRCSKFDRSRIFWTAETPTQDNIEASNVSDVRTDGCCCVAISKNEAQ